MASGRQGTKPQQAAAAAADQEFDPEYDWQENATGFILRLHLSGFRKEDFRVQVDGTGRLTVRSQRTNGARHSRFDKVFQLPATSNLDDITGRFDAGVLTLNVPKRPAAPPATTIQEIKNQPGKQQFDDAKPKEDEAKKPQPEHKEAAEMTTRKPKDDAKPKEDAMKPPAEQQMGAARRGKPQQEQRKAAAPPAPVGKEEAKPKAVAAASPPTDKKQATTLKPVPQADAEPKAIDPESLPAVTAKRRAEEESAAAEEAEHQRPRRGFTVDLDDLAGSEWAESLLETVKKNREVIAVAVAAFSLGVFVSSRLCSRN